MANFGGRIIFNFGGTAIPPVEGSIELDPTAVESEAQANQDGSIAYMVKPKVPGAELRLRDAARYDWQALLMRTGDVTIDETDNNVTHFFTGARLVGNPKINRSTGEVTGLRVAGGQYKRR